MSLKVSRCLPASVLVLAFFAAQLPMNAQSVPCAAITRNPLVLEALLDSHSKDSDSDLQDDTINAAQLERLQFGPIVIQPGDALYVEYRGRDFTLNADFASGERTEFDSSPKGSYEQWRKGVLPLDMFRGALNQRVVRLRATAKNPNQVLFRNIKIIRAGRSVFEFAKLASYGRTQLKRAARKELPCKGVDEYPNETAALAQANLLVPAKSVPKSPLTLTAQEINSMNLDYSPVIQAGDFMVFESNRRDFIFHLLLSNGKEIVSRPLTQEDAEDTAVAWRKGRIRLDYPEALNQRIVRQALIPLHEGGTPLLLRGVRIDGNRELIFELEQSQPGKAKPKSVEPPMSYPPDPHVMTASATAPNIWGHQPETGFLAPKLPAFSMEPMMFQSSGGTADPNHYKYAGQELDDESGLYHMGARYYSPGLGRFTSPDPLYIEMHRLADPQQLNLYAYSRNNPTTLSDPSGLDIAVNCKDKANCTAATDQVNSRKDGQFKVEIGKDGKWHPVGDVDASKLKGAEKAFYGALTDTNTHATLTAVSGDGGVFFGMSTGQGKNTVDVADTAQLAGAGLSPGSAVAHEAMEAYATAGGASQKDAHDNDPFPGFTILGSGGRPVINGGNLTGYQYTLRYNATGANYQVNTTLATPIPVASFTNPQTRAAAQKAVSTTEQVVGVTAAGEKPK